MTVSKQEQTDRFRLQTPVGVVGCDSVEALGELLDMLEAQRGQQATKLVDRSAEPAETEFSLRPELVKKYDLLMESLAGKVGLHLINALHATNGRALTFDELRASPGLKSDSSIALAFGMVRRNCADVFGSGELQFNDQVVRKIDLVEHNKIVPTYRLHVHFDEYLRQRGERAGATTEAARRSTEPGGIKLSSSLTKKYDQLLQRLEGTAGLHLIWAMHRTRMRVLSLDEIRTQSGMQSNRSVATTLGLVRRKCAQVFQVSKMDFTSQIVRKVSPAEHDGPGTAYMLNVYFDEYLLRRKAEDGSNEQED